MIADFKPYPAMKDSGVPWLREVPTYWEVMRLRNTSEMRVSNVDKHAKDDEQPVRLCNYVDVYKNDRIRSGMAFMRATATTDEIERFRLQSGDVLITKDSEAWNDIGVPALVEDTQDDIVSGYHLALLRPFPERVDGGYLFRVLQSPAVAYQFHVEANGVTRYGLSHRAIRSVWLPLPPLAEQAAIVRFLDHADRRIRRYIRAKQKLIKLLEEQKQILIHRAVTRGLAPNVRLKPSGVEWLGEVPAHWAEAIKIKYVSSLKGRLGWQGLKAGEYTSEGPYIVSSAHFRNHKINWKICPHVTQERYEMDKHIQLAHGDILLMKDGAAMGKLAFVDELPGLACLNSHLLLFRPLADNGGIAYLPQFMFYYMQTECFQGYAQVNGTGATFLGISQESIGNHTVCLPPISEQTAVVEYLNHETADLDTTTASANRQIDLLREYHTRLIADVVTGKLDVRSAATRLPDEADKPVPIEEDEEWSEPVDDDIELPEALH